MRRRLLTVPTLLLGLLSGCGEDPPAPAAGIPAEHLDEVARRFNQGIGLMERFQPEAAVQSFEEVVGLAPGWTPGRLNLGIALLNVNDEPSRARAEAELGWVVEREPRNLTALYSLGMLLRHVDRPAEAQALFERVLEADPDDADAHYQLGILAQEDDPAAARLHLERTLELMPHHESACYRLAAPLREAGEPPRARPPLDRFRALHEAEARELAGMKDREKGPHAHLPPALHGDAA
ncbi:MAG: tetratricopeptide repeat protein, partial [Planctomycetes bacterium]|nr:tetratricopeptide repeat protein [Planctomycetota bacterium]